LDHEGAKSHEGREGRRLNASWSSRFASFAHLRGFVLQCAVSVDDGQIAEHWAVVDMLDMMQQIEAVSAA
jgi:hypothetical protein